MSPRQLAAVVALSFACPATPVDAATIDIVGGARFSSLQSVALSGDTMTVTGTFTPFDTSLGTLIAASFGPAASLSAGLILSDLEPGDYIFGILVELQLLDSHGTVLHSDTGALAASVRTVLDDGSIYPSGFGTGVPYEVIFVDGNSYGAGFPNRRVTQGLDRFITPSEFTAKLIMSISFSSGPLAGQTFPADSVQGSFSIGGYDQVVRYEYVPVPEPGTALLVGSGLMFTALCARRRPPLWPRCLE